MDEISQGGRSTHLPRIRYWYCISELTNPIEIEKCQTYLSMFLPISIIISSYCCWSFRSVIFKFKLFKNSYFCLWIYFQPYKLFNSQHLRAPSFSSGIFLLLILGRIFLSKHYNKYDLGDIRFRSIWVLHPLILKLNMLQQETAFFHMLACRRWFFANDN